jgi:glyoxylase-like metal-dependent hydrolase (beta-lactamase superfamily II)
LIDTSLFAKETSDTFEDALRSLEITLSDIKTVVFTHCHPDHFGLAGWIKQHCPGTSLLMHRWEASLVEARYVNFLDLRGKTSILLKSHGVPLPELEPLSSAFDSTVQYVTFTSPDYLLYGGETVSTGIFNLEIIWTPGHSPGHLCLYEPQNQLLFSGDHVLPSITPNISYQVMSGDNPLGDYLQALNKIKYLPLKLNLPGHRNPFPELSERTDSIIRHHQRRENEILKVMNGSRLNSYEIAALLNWKVDLPWEKLPPRQKRSAITETIAHMEHLRWEGRVEKTTSANSISYRPIGN